jgi:thiosulfate reductase / polysulfide reductase chain A
MNEVIRSICQACHCECGVFVHVKNGKVVKVTGDPSHPMNRGFICVKGRAYPDIVYHPDRVKYPLKRSGERGSGKWERISWEQALEEIAAKLTQAKEKYGPESFASIKGTGPRPTLYSVSLLAGALRSPNCISVDLHICAMVSNIAENAVFGSSGSVMMENGPDYLNSNCILVVGGNPLASHPPRGNDILQAKKKRGAKLIVIDPRRTELAARADLWLQVRPGTDVALALAMINVILEEDLYDHRFVDKYCYGLNELRGRAKEYPLERVANLTWVPADKIREAARLYATTKPAALHHRVAIEQNINSTQNCRALAMMIALTGNFDVQGGNVPAVRPPGYIGHRSLYGVGQMFRLSRDIEERRIGAKEFPLFAGPDAVCPILPAPLAHESMRLGKPYAIKSLFAAGANPILNMQNTKSVWKSMKSNLDLLVVAEFFMTPTAEIADYVLPAATWLERDDTCEMMYNHFVSARQKAIEPLYESWHDMKIVIELVKRIPWADRRFMPWNDVDEFNQALVRGAGIDFNELKQKSHLLLPIPYRRYENKGFNTPTGKVELFSKLFEKHGYDPLPWYREPLESPLGDPKMLSEYPLVLFTGSRHLEFFHSEGRQISALRSRVPDPLVELNPQTANLYNITDGDWVWIESPQVKGERVKLKAKLTDTIHPRMVHARHAWWFPEMPAPEHGCFDSNISVILTDDPPREAVCASVTTRGTLCKIYKVSASLA